MTHNFLIKIPKNMKYSCRNLALAAMAAFAVASLSAESLVLVHSNDTHSQIDPTDKDLGGIARRKAVVDSIRRVHPNVLLIDAGDAVQGTLFFTLYGGEVEIKMMNELGYDLAILGNHDFDNGMKALERNLALSDAQWITTNYDLSATDIKKYFKPYVIKEYDGKKVAFIGLNLIPKGMISEGNYDGVKYLDAVKAANATAWHLKHNEGVDMVVAITHLGYDEVPPSDRAVAENSEDIDIILGGHSHSLIRPGSGQEWIPNADGRNVLVAQNGKSGLWVSEIEIDLDSIGKKAPEYRQIAIDSRLDSRTDPRIDSLLQPYRAGIDRLMKDKIGRTSRELTAEGAPLLNFISDFVLDRAKGLEGAGKVDLAITNKGSLRRNLPAGNITRGQIIMLQPFNNRILVETLKGSDLLEALNVMASRGGDGVSRGVDVEFDPATGKCTRVTINGEPLDPARTYRVATIDYLANGGDYMQPLTRGEVVARSNRIMHADLTEYIEKEFKGKKINPSDKVRMHAAR